MTDSGRSVSYVLSTYLSPPGHRAFTSRRHDQSVALWQHTGNRIALRRYWELERLSGRKHHEMPLHGDRSSRELVDILLGREGLSAGDLDAVWGTPGLDLGETLPPLERHGLPAHSLAHLFSGLCIDAATFRNSTIVALALDGGPDFTLEDDVLADTWYAGAVSTHGKVALYPVESPGPLWQCAQQHFQMEPGSLMALAQATPAVVDVSPASFLAERYWGGYALMVRCFDLLYSAITQARRSIKGVAKAGQHGFTSDELVASAVMKVVQSVSIGIARRNVEFLLERAGCRPQDAYLSMTGGYALNCPTNSYLIDTFGFKGLLTPPCANDSGQALGIGLMGFFARGDLETCDVEVGLPFAGERASIGQARSRWPTRILAESEFDESVFVSDLRSGPVAWVDGAAEVGPRALGHRSLLGDPTRSRTKDVLNAVKRRQWWRPVAPIVLEEHACDWFENGRRSPFMLETFRVRPSRADQIPAAVHIDGTARIQTLSEGDDSALHRAVSAFYRATGVPVVCNTSLNDRGEPIVNDAAEALNFCLRKGIGVAYVEGRRVVLDTTNPAAATGPERRTLHDLYASQPARPATIYGDDADFELMFLLYLSPGLGRLAAVPQGQARLRQILADFRDREPTFVRRAEQFGGYWKALLEGAIKEGAADAA